MIPIDDDLAQTGDSDAELADRIGLAEHRLTRLRVIRQRMEAEGEDTFRTDRQMQELERRLEI